MKTSELAQRMSKEWHDNPTGETLAEFIDRHFQPLIAKVEDQRQDIVTLQTLKYGRERAQAEELTALRADLAAAKEENEKLKTVCKEHFDTGCEYLQSILSLKTDLAAKEAALGHYAHADFLTTEQQQIADTALQSHAK